MGRVLIVVLAVAVVIGISVVNRKESEIAPTPAPSQSAQTNSEMFATPGPLTANGAEVEYTDGVGGYYAEPTTPGDYPGVIMVHEWWGLNQNIKDMAVLLASRGYKVLAVDLFGKVATTSQEAQAQTAALDQEKALQNMTAAKDYLTEAGVSEVASLGWCFGGGQSLQMALADKHLAATVIYYGRLENDEGKLNNIDWPVLGIFGEEDQSIPVEQVREFETALNNLEIENEIYIYPGVGHAFANPSGSAYAPSESMDAWNKTLSFLDNHLK